MNKFTLNRDEVVLLVIDIQDRLARVMEYRDQVIYNNKILITAAREMDFPFLVTEQYPKGLGRTVPELLEVLEDEPVFTKVSFTAYVDEVREALRSLGRKKVLVTGMETHICVYRTVRELIEDGYQVYVIRDGVASRTKANYENGLEQMQAMGAVITNTETVAFDLLKKSGTAEFKILSAMIK